MTRRRAFCQWAGFIGLAVLFSAATLLAVHATDLFELGDGVGTSGSGDILDDPGQAGCDWASLFDSDPTDEEIATAVEACGGLQASFVADDLSQGKTKDDTVFSTGSSKNDAPIAQWQWQTGNSPSKDDISNFYAYATLNEANELIIYAGVERLDPSGDSHIDFELNQSFISLDTEPPCGNDRSDGNDDRAPCEFIGEKVEQDILVMMDFQNGGDFGTLELRQWDGVTYQVIESLDGEGCNAADTVCAVNNGFTIDGGPWPSFDGKGALIADIEPNGFTEAAINVTQLLGGNTPCFSTLQAKTRSSASFNSSLKDFALASFSICSVELDKSAAGPTGEPLSKIGDLVTFSYDVTNTGGGDLFLREMQDSTLGDITDTATANGCAVLPTGGTCTFDIVQAIPEDADDPLTSAVSVTYVTLADIGTALNSASLTGDPVQNALPGRVITTVDDTDVETIELFQPAVAVSKAADPFSVIGNTVTYTITVTNTGSADSPDLANGVIDDTLLGDLLDANNPFIASSTCAGTLLTGGSCTIVAQRVVQAGDPDPLPNTVTVTYNPAGGFPNVITDSAGATTDIVHPGCDVQISALPASVMPGDVVTYGYTFANTGDVIIDTISVDDTLLGNLTGSFPTELSVGQTFSTDFTRTALDTDPSPLTNTTTAVCGVRGVPDTTVTATATVDIDIFEPSIAVIKTGDSLSTAGNTASYAFSISNTSSAATPDLVGGSITDTLLGDLLDAANPYVVSSTCAATLGAGGNCTIQAGRVVQAGDPDPLPNVVSVSYTVPGLPAPVVGSDDHMVDLVHPDLTLSANITPDTASPGDTITWTFVLTNPGDVFVDRITVIDTFLGDISASFPAALAPGASVTVTLTHVVVSSDPDPLTSTSTATYDVRGLPNQVIATATDSVDIIIRCALSPGFWKGGEGVPKWDNPADPIAMAAGFYGGTPFPWLDASLTGSSYLDVLNTSRAGDVTLQLGFKYIAARLNQATFGVPGGTGALLDAIDAYLAVNPVGSDPKGQAKNQGQALLSQLNAYFSTVGEGGCPAPGEF